jgi:hypothetical protein
VAPDPIKPVGSGAATTVTLAQKLSDDMGGGGRALATSVAWGLAWA